MTNPTPKGMTTMTLRTELEEILNNVEFMHGVPVSAPKEVVDKIETVFIKHLGIEKKIDNLQKKIINLNKERDEAIRKLNRL